VTAPRRPGGAELAQLLALWAAAGAHPVLDVIATSPEFLAQRGTPPLEAWTFAALVALAVPLLAFGAERVLSAAGPGAARGLHLALAGLAGAYLALAVLKRVIYRLDPVDPPIPAAVVIVLALAAGAGVVWLVHRSATARSALAALWFAPLLVLALFLARTEAPKALDLVAAASPRTPVPVVVVLLDEVPVTSLLDADGAIDSARFPAFARLGRMATWYPRATTVSDATAEAVPAILTGRRPGPAAVPATTAQAYPRNLFTLLRDSHRVRASEVETRLCPGQVCAERSGRSLPGRFAAFAADAGRILVQFAAPAQFAQRLPGIRAPQDFEQQVDRFLEGIRPAGAPELSFLHLELPHVPYVFLPEGERYVEQHSEAELLGLEGAKWTSNAPLVVQGHQRHLLQTGYADRLLGRILDDLERRDILDDAVLVVAADHGIAFDPGRETRLLPAAGIEHIAPVPLFVKLPGQRAGRIDRRPVETIDILPTILAANGVPAGEVDGRDLAGARPPEAPVRVRAHLGRELVTIARPQIERRGAELLAERVRGFGSGSFDAVYGALRPGLAGRPAAEAAGAQVVGARLDAAPAGRLPALTQGTLTPASSVRAGCLVALDAGGTIAAAAVVRAGGRFSALVPPSRRDTRGRVRVLRLPGRGC